MGSRDTLAQWNQHSPLLLFSWLLVLLGQVIPPARHLCPAHGDIRMGEGPHVAGCWQARDATQPAWTADGHTQFRGGTCTGSIDCTNPRTHTKSVDCTRTHTHAHVSTPGWLGLHVHTHTHTCRQPAWPSVPEPSCLSQGQALPEGSRQGKPRQLRCLHPCDTPHQQTHLLPRTVLARSSPRDM